MKRSFLFLSMILAIVAASAQDTLVYDMKPEYILNNHWPPKGRNCYETFGIDCDQRYLFSEFYVAKPTKIYGMAVFCLPKEYDASSAENTTIFLGLFARNLDNPVFRSDVDLMKMRNSPVKLISDSLFLTPGKTEPTYYYYFKSNGEPNTEYAIDYYDRVYEIYFDSAIIVDGYFMLGRSVTSKMRIPDIQWHEGVRPVYYNIYWNTHSERYVFCPDYNYEWTTTDALFCYKNNTSLDKLFKSTKGYHFLWFPIINPNDNDTLAVGEVQLVQRFVSVQPNPARDNVRVLSSVGMESVEAYNMAGEKVAQWETTEQDTQLDVSSLPSGVYILNIKTPMGVASKKLVVQ